MLIIGEITAPEGVGPDRWLALIQSHEALSKMPPRQTINPFTRQPCEIEGPASTALVHLDGVSIGSIYWAMDGSPMLIVQAEEDSVDAVARTAEEIAGSLGGQFVRQSY